MTERESSSAANPERGVSGGERGSGTLIAVVVVIGLVAIGGVVVAMGGLPGGDGSTPINETEQNRTNGEQLDTRQETTGTESFDSAVVETSNQAPVDRWDTVAFTNQTDTGIASEQKARMLGLDNHAELVATEFEEAGLNVSGAEGQLYSTRYPVFEGSTAYANFSSVRVTIEEDQDAAEAAVDLTARTLPDVATNGSPPATYANTSGEALQPDYVTVMFQHKDGRVIGIMATNTASIEAYQQGEISRAEYANRTIGSILPADPRRWNTGDSTVEPPQESPEEILTAEGLYEYESGLLQSAVNYTEYEPPRYNVIPRYYEADEGVGFEVEIYVDENESLATTLPLSARTIGYVGLVQASEMRGGAGFNFVDATYYTHDGEKLGEVRYDPETAGRYAVGNLTASEYATSDDTISSFNATHPDAESITERNMTQLAREGQLRLWADQYEYILAQKYGHELHINSTTVDVDDEELHVHTSVNEWPDDTASTSPASMRTHTTDALQHVYANQQTSVFEPKEGIYIYQENNVRFNGRHGLRRNSMLTYADTGTARQVTSNGRDSQEALQWAADVTFNATYFYRGYEPESTEKVFNKTLGEWKESSLTFTASDEIDPPDDE